MPIPQVQSGAVSSIAVGISGPQRDSHWADNIFTKLQIEQPVLAEYLVEVRKQYGQQAMLTGLLMYRFIESQIEADDLRELIG